MKVEEFLSWVEVWVVLLQPLAQELAQELALHPQTLAQWLAELCCGQELFHQAKEKHMVSHFYIRNSDLNSTNFELTETV
jgi:hypothetical protein